MAGARGLLINITGGPDLTLFEVDEAANRVRDEVDPQANIIFGSAFDESLEGRIRVSVFATGIESQVAQKPKGEAPRATPMARPAPVRMPIEAAEPPAVQRPAAPVPAPAARPAAEPAPMRPAARQAEVAETPIPRRAMEPRREAPVSRPAMQHDYETVLPAAAPPTLAMDDDAPAHAAAAATAPEEQPDMFVAAEGRRPAPMEQAAPERHGGERPRAPMAPRPPAPRMEAAPRHEPAPRGRVVAYVDDIEPERNSPEQTIRTGEARTGEARTGDRDSPSRTARPSIFNLWRGRKAEDEMRRAEPAAPMARTRPEPAAPTPLRAPQPQAENPVRQPAAGPNIETQQPRRAKDDDVLEIPAFLRRQAN